jgi:transcriptional regulator with GAF, ATPase, and Fis domain
MKCRHESQKQSKGITCFGTRELEKVGSSKLMVVNVRVIAATNKMLEEEIEAG